MEMICGIAREAAAYPPKLVKTVFKALRKQLKDDHMLNSMDQTDAGPNTSAPFYPVELVDGKKLEEMVQTYEGIVDASWVRSFYQTWLRQQGKMV